MLVNVLINRRDPEGRLAFIKFESKLHGTLSLPAYFDKNNLTDKTGEMEVMICGVLMPKGDRVVNNWNNTETYTMENTTLWDQPPRCLFIRCPTAEDTKISYRGFECSGSMCSTTAVGAREYGTKDKFVGLVTPGRLFDHLVIADNVNVGWQGQKAKPLTAGTGWIRRHPNGGAMQLVGVESTAELKF